MQIVSALSLSTFWSARLCCAIFAFGLTAMAQQAPPSAPADTSAAIAPTVAPKAQIAPPQVAQVVVTEEALKQLLVGKALYLRGGYQDNTLSFNEHGRPSSHSVQGPYTLSGVQIDKVRLTKHKVELEGIRFGLHFVGQLAYEDPTKAMDRVRITPKKKILKITIDREMVVKPKKIKAPAVLQALTVSQAPGAQAAATQLPDKSEAERPADAASVTTATSPEHAARVLTEALDQIFAPGLDERMLAAMPDFWKLYYQAVETKTDYRPKDPSILRQNMVDRKARLVSTFEPASNEYAQANGVAGMALYHTVIGPDGKAGEIAVGRPIGFGLDENAVESIRKASFEPALKEGKPVSVLLDLVVQFRIFSKWTAELSPVEPAEKSAPSVLPGPYSVPHS
jgi:hypothetical protein